MTRLRVMPPGDDGDDGHTRRIQGEIVPPSPEDRIAAWFEQQVQEGKIDRSQLRALIPNLQQEIDPDAGRALFAGFGGMFGSMWRTIGAGVGAAAGAALYDLIKMRVEDGRRRRRAQWDRWE